MRYVLAVFALLTALIVNALILDPPGVYFGRVYEDGGIVSDTILLINDSKEDCAILTIRPECSCVSVYTDGDYISANDTLKAVLTFNPRMYSGDVDKSVLIRTTLDSKPIKLHVKANVQMSDSLILTRYPIDLGDLRIAEDTFRIPKGRKDAVIMGYNASADTISITVTEVCKDAIVNVYPSRVAPESKATIVLSLPQEATEGYCDGCLITTSIGVHRLTWHTEDNK